MPKIKHFVALLALIAVAIWLLSFFNFESKNTDSKLNPELSQSQQQTTSEPVNEIQTAPNVVGQDPFKKFLEEKAGKANPTTQSENSRALPVQSSKDPFKEFLEKQKQNSKDQVVSPFGKN
jgi:hypothetical protein